MIHGAILAFVAGVGLLQQQAELPGHAPWLIAAGLLGSGAAWIIGRCVSIHPGADAWSGSGRGIQLLLVLSASAVLGFGWAAQRAAWRMADALPPAWEGRDVLVTGTIASLPKSTAQGVRFRLEVEAVEPAGAPIPRMVSLGWYRGYERPEFPGPARTGPVQRRADGDDEGSGGSGGRNPATDGDADVAGAGGGVDAAALAFESVPRLNPGERWRLPVRLKRPHGTANPHGFDVEQWMLVEGVRASGHVRAVAKGLPRDWKPQRLDEFVWRPAHVVERARAAIRARILASLGSEARYAGVIVALVIGDQQSIDASDWTVFNRTGIGHLVSISGLHVTMIAGLFAAAAGWFWRRSFFTGAQLPLRLPAQQVAAIAGALSAFLYCLLAGFQIPAQRTLYMLSVVALALLGGRQATPRHILILALAVVVVPDPWAVLAPGFWLSFGAVAVILYAMAGNSAQVLPELGARWRAMLYAAVRVQMVVTLGLVPLTILLFQQVSVVSPVANALAIPLVSFFVTPLALLGCALPQPLAGIAWWLSHGAVQGLATVLGWMAGFSWAVWQASTPPLWAVLLALAGVGWIAAPGPWRWPLPPRWLGIPLLLPVLLGSERKIAPGEFRLVALDVGQGSAVVVQTASHRLLYDAGPRYTTAADAGARVVLPYLRGEGIITLDALVISHQDIDHAGGARSVLEGVRTGTFHSPLAPTHPLVRDAGRLGARPGTCVRGDSWEWDGVRFTWLHPDLAEPQAPLRRSNAGSCVLRIANGRHAALLTGDIESPQEYELTSIMDKSLMMAGILLVPHHGSGTSSSDRFLDAVRPEIAIMQLGYRNRFGHPKAEVEQRYRERGIGVLRTDLMGAVGVETTGPALVTSLWRGERRRYWMNNALEAAK